MKWRQSSRVELGLALSHMIYKVLLKSESRCEESSTSFIRYQTAVVRRKWSHRMKCKMKDDQDEGAR